MQYVSLFCHLHMVESNNHTLLYPPEDILHKKKQCLLESLPALLFPTVLFQNKYLILAHFSCHNMALYLCFVSKHILLSLGQFFVFFLLQFSHRQKIQAVDHKESKPLNTQWPFHNFLFFHKLDTFFHM